MIFTPPMNIAYRDFSKPSVFLAGSIEMGTADNWQDDVGSMFLDEGFNVFNPRRADWDSSWTQDFSNPQFYQQVNWELDSIDTATYVYMYFDPRTKSPITLLELGYLLRDGVKLVVVCPEGYWRKGNVDVVCQRHNVPQFKTDEEAIIFIVNHHNNS